jgi:hypothetical protein
VTGELTSGKDEARAKRKALVQRAELLDGSGALARQLVSLGEL